MTNLLNVFPEFYQASELTTALFTDLSDQVDDLYSKGVDWFLVGEQIGSEQDTVIDFLSVLSGFYFTPFYRQWLTTAVKENINDNAYLSIWPLRGTRTALESTLGYLVPDLSSNYSVRSFGDVPYPGISLGEYWVVVPLVDDYRSSSTWQVAEDTLEFNRSIIADELHVGVCYSIAHADYTVAEEPVWS